MQYKKFAPANLIIKLATEGVQNFPKIYYIRTLNTYQACCISMVPQSKTFELIEHCILWQDFQQEVKTQDMVQVSVTYYLGNKMMSNVNNTRNLILPRKLWSDSAFLRAKHVSHTEIRCQLKEVTAEDTRSVQHVRILYRALVNGYMNTKMMMIMMTTVPVGLANQGWMSMQQEWSNSF